MPAETSMLDRADRVTATGVFILRFAAGLFFLIPGLWKIAQPADFQAMLVAFPETLQPHLPTLFILVTASEIIGGVLLIAGFNFRFLIAPLVLIIMVASGFVVQFDMSSNIRVFSLYAHGMAGGLYVSLFFLGSGRWSLDRGKDLIYGLSTVKLGKLSVAARDLVSGAGRNTGVFLLRASIAFPFLVVAALCVVGADHASLPDAPLFRAGLATLALLGGLSALTGFWIGQMAWLLIALTLAHFALVALPDASVSRIGLINLLMHGLLMSALLALRMIRAGSDLEVDHILKADVKNIVIVGGGFAGTSLAKHLERQLPASHRVVLISEATYTTFNPLLAEIVGASVLPSHTIAPIRRMVRRSRFILGKVETVDFNTRTVHFRTEDEMASRPFDHIIFALGARANRNLMPGMAENSFPFKLIGDALDLRNRVIRQMELADQSDDPAERQRLGRFIVIGGGFSGVEVAGAIHDYIHGAGAHYPRLHDADLGVTLVHGTDCLLPELPEALGRYAKKSLAKRGLDVRCNARVDGIEPGAITLGDGSRIIGATIVNTIGTTPNPLIAALDIPTERGRVVVEADMQIPGIDRAWALGDCAFVPNKKDGTLSPPTAQFAIREGEQLADNIARAVRGKPTKPFTYSARGAMAGIGHLDGVASLMGLITLTGLPAWLLWRAYYLSLMPTVLRKTQIFFEWTWSMLFSADITALRFLTSEEADAADKQAIESPVKLETVS